MSHDSTTTTDSRLRVGLRETAVALAAGVAALAGSYAVAGFTPEFVAAPVSRLVVAATPDAVVAWSIGTLGDLGARLGFALAVALTVGAFAVAASVGTRLAERVGISNWTVAGLACAAVAFGLTGAVVAGLAAGVGASVVIAAAGVQRRGPTDPSAVRRRILRAVAASAAVGSVGGVLGSRQGGESERTDAEDVDISPEVEGLLGGAAERSLDVSGIEPLVSQQFYQVDINGVDPSIDADSWSLRVTGAVEDERDFDYDDLTGMESEHRFVTLRCVGEPLNGKKMDNALWTGVAVTDLLGDLPEECCVMARAVDDYFQEFPLSALEDAFLAYEMNGRPLPRGHGHPVRLLVPGHWGEINVKWITELEVLEQEVEGYWEERGWNGTGPVETVAKLHAVNHLEDGRVQVGGHAYAGTRGIETVEVSTDGGETWTDAHLSDELPGDDVWRQWEHTYEPSGAHEVVVRATDSEGTLQPREERDAFPNGATGWVTERVEP
ncbi:molybdopterin-dependent oxidoreductase [Halorussus amylolyticus]|uniref:molybdopterin-dependent oxidoreductase n=1 Tax=Halorussus amylolyticus TaxID=1126242 RepID=UPI001049D99B|nr:molybdopterin-dependent oxidoreductase [Halorussus amylolyticus]